MWIVRTKNDPQHNEVSGAAVQASLLILLLPWQGAHLDQSKINIILSHPPPSLAGGSPRPIKEVNMI